MVLGCRVFLALVLAWLVTLPVLAQAAADAQPFAEKLLASRDFQGLRAGGYVLYMRHGNTDNSRPDAFPRVNLEDCATQRPLNEEGRRVAAQVGRYIRQAAIPVGEVIYSPLCRARDSARLAFATLGDKVRPELNLMYPANMTSEEKKPVVAMTRQLLSAPVARGTNRVLVAHAPNLADVMGYYVKPEGTVVVIRPLGAGRFDYVGSIHPDMWPRLLGSLKTRPAP